MMFKNRRYSQLTIIKVQGILEFEDEIEDGLKAKDPWKEFLDWYTLDDTEIFYLDEQDLFEPIKRFDILHFYIRCYYK